MTDPPRRAQAGVWGDDCMHQFLGVQIAFHQQGDLSGTSKRDRFCRSGRAVRRIDHVVCGDVHACSFRHRLDL